MYLVITAQLAISIFYGLQAYEQVFDLHLDFSWSIQDHVLIWTKLYWIIKFFQYNENWLKMCVICDVWMFWYFWYV